VCFDLLNCQILSSKTRNESTEFLIIKDERLVSKMEGKNQFFEAPACCQEPGLLRKITEP